MIGSSEETCMWSSFDFHRWKEKNYTMIKANSSNWKWKSHYGTHRHWKSYGHRDSNFFSSSKSNSECHGTCRNSAGHWGASEDALSFSFARRSRKEVAVLIMISLFPRDFCFEFFFLGSISDVVKKKNWCFSSFRTKKKNHVLIYSETQ